VVVGSERRQALEATAPGHTLALPFSRPARSVRTIAEYHRRSRLDAVVGTDDETTVLAARAAAELGLRHNPVGSVRATRDKYAMRRKLADAGLHGPSFRRIPVGRPPELSAGEIRYPCVVKPLSLAASRGVLRADDPESFVAAFRRVAALCEQQDVRLRGGTRYLLVEDYLPGDEFAVEGLLRDGELHPLALFDKPDPLTGPTFEETLFLTPSRFEPGVQEQILAEAAAGCRALGLVEGPVHAELRRTDGRPWLLEVAPRTIGGLCSRTLRFGTGVSLEELVLRHALGLDTVELRRETAAAGVLMLPVPGTGVLRRVRGLDTARAVPGIEEITLTMHRGARLVPLPEGHRYLGFAFARGDDPSQVEQALREARDRLRFDIVPAE
jgi:biotin carboxylase